MAVWYRVGTVSVTQSSPTVTGNGTVFTSVVREGDMFTVDENIFYEIAAVVSDTQLTLTKNYAQASASNVSYAIVPLSPRRHLASDLGRRVDDLIVRYRDKFDAVIVTADEINTLDNVTSNVQTQLNSKVTGPASATDDAVVAYDGTSGKLVKNTAKKVADVVTGPASAVDGNLPVFYGTTGKVIKDTGLTPTIIVKDARREAVEAASGGAMTVLYDDLNNPSYMFRLTPFNLEDIDPVYGTGVHPAFYVNGVLKKEIFIGAFQSKVISSRACSLPGADPTTNVNFDTAKTYCTSKGAGWHLMTNWEWAAVALWCLKNGFQPRGNTNYGRSHGATYETGTRIDGIAPGTTSEIARTLTGSGPASWRHNNTFTGIADLVGNVSEWVDGLKLADGKIYMPSDNNFNLAETSWPDTGVKFDSTATGDESIPAQDIGDPVISNAITKYAGPTGDDGQYGYLQITNWKDLTKKDGYTVPISMLQALIAPITLAGGTYSQDPKGALYVRNYGARFPLRGGTWFDGAGAGLFCLDLNYARSNSFSILGFRLAFIG